MSDSASFQLSRIYADGWKAGTKQGRSKVPPADGDAGPEINPNLTSGEQAKWREGFDAGLASSRRTSQKAHVAGWSSSST